MLILVMSLLDGSLVTLLSLACMAKGSGDWLVVMSSRIVSAEVCGSLHAYIIVLSSSFG